jgi:TonB family protein
MNAASVHPGFSRRRLWGWAVLILAAQTGFIFLLGARHPVLPRAPDFSPPVTLAPGYSPELSALLDPTLFALPHLQAFSGAALALAPRTGYVSDDWTEPFRPLPLPVAQLGQTFRELSADTVTPPLSVAEKIEPPTPPLKKTGDVLALPERSTLRIEGGVAGRALLTPPELPSVPSVDVFQYPTIVRVIVDAAGDVVSAVPVQSCGQADADDKAMTLARAAQFEPLPGDEKTRLAHPQAGLSWGRLIFQWHVVPLPPAEEPSSMP